MRREGETNNSGAPLGSRQTRNYVPTMRHESSYRITGHPDEISFSDRTHREKAIGRVPSAVETGRDFLVSVAPGPSSNANKIFATALGTVLPDFWQLNSSAEGEDFFVARRDSVSREVYYMLDAGIYEICIVTYFRHGRHRDSRFPALRMWVISSYEMNVPRTVIRGMHLTERHLIRPADRVSRAYCIMRR